jgi:hypothetical protein
MAQVMIKCPKTGKLVPTGIVMDKISFKTSTLTNNTLGNCPACGENHVWSKKDAILI